MKNILMIGTGGTIASEMTPSGLTPELNSTQLLSFVPRIGEMCHVDCVQLYSLDSTNIRPAHWLGVARAVRENYDRYDGFVISHGTDTMAYTAAALSYLIQGSPKPIVLTGAQKPIWFDGTDSKRNLTDAFLYACRGCGGVQIVFNGKVILGTRARKTCSKSFQAFSSVNYPDLAVVQDEYYVPLIVQLLLVELIIDILKIASLNTPDVLSNSFSMLGALILGDFAVQARWLVPEVLVYMAFVAVANYAQHSYEMGYATKLCRILLLVLIWLWDWWGFAAGIVITLMLIVTAKPLVGKGYLYPLIPFDRKKLARLLYRRPVTKKNS